MILTSMHRWNHLKDAGNILQAGGHTHFIMFAKVILPLCDHTLCCLTSVNGVRIGRFVKPVARPLRKPDATSLLKLQVRPFRQHRPQQHKVSDLAQYLVLNLCFL